jgi:hypothetical protein
LFFKWGCWCDIWGIEVEKYVSEWIEQTEDITEYCKGIHRLIRENKIEEAKNLLPVEQLYPLPQKI